MVLLLGIYSLMAQNSPDLRCLKVEINGSITLSWLLPANTVNLLKFDIYYSQNGVDFTLVGNVTSTTTNYNHVDAHALINPLLHYYVDAVFSTNDTARSNTLKTIEFYLTNQNDGLAYLNWYPPTEPLLPSYDDVYTIEKNSPLTTGFVFADHQPVTNSMYKDTIDICHGPMMYRLSLSDLETGCLNVSRVQGDIFNDKIDPLPPNLDSVSVDFETDRIVLGWTPSVSGDVTAYIIYHFIGGADGWQPIDTVHGYLTTFWVDTLRSASSITEYRIAALDSCMNSSFMSEPQQTMLISSSSPDLCRQVISLSWSPYLNMTGGLEKYCIYYCINDGELQYAGEVSSSTTSFDMNDIMPDSYYKFIVRAIGNSGEISATSFAYEYNSSGYQGEHFAYLRYATVVNNSDVELRIWTGADTLPFKTLNIYRHNEVDTLFALIGTIPYDGTGDYSFVDKDVATSSTVFYYKTEIYNECDIMTAASNTAHTILLSGGNGEERDIHLKWNSYGDWNGEVMDYLILRKFQTELSFEDIGNVHPDPILTYSENVEPYFSYGSDFTYCVTARETLNAYGFRDESTSNVITISQGSVTYIPNAFVPEGVNNIFMPVNSFVSVNNYIFSIYSRAGQLLFQTKDPYMGWDGKMNGVIVPAGVYVYRLSYTNPDGTFFEKSGSVTLIR